MPIIILYALLMIPWLTDLRVVMGDEAAYADPALRWNDDQGFTSIAWQQTPDELWAGNFPLHAWSIAAWVRVTGADSLFGLRLQSLLLYCGGLLLWVYAMRRHTWTTTWWQDSLFAILFLTSLYGAGPSQYIRPEALAASIFALGLLSLSWQSPLSRRTGLFFTGLLACWAGIPFSLALAAGALCWLVHHRLRPWPDFIACGLGGIAGAIFLYFFYQSHGVWDVFLAATFGHGENRMAQWQGWRDPMLVATTAVLGIGLLTRSWPQNVRPVAVWGLILGIGLPTTFFLLSKFPNYYGFYALLPLCSATAITLPQLWQTTPSPSAAEVPLNNQKSPSLSTFQLFSLLLLAGAACVGFPLSALLSWNTLDQRRYQPMEEWITTNSSPGDLAFVDPAAYFAIRKVNPQFFTQFSLSRMPADQKQEINTLITWKNSSLRYLNAAHLKEQLGGSWELASSYNGADRGGLRVPALAPLARLSYAAPYQLEIWRKKKKF